MRHSMAPTCCCSRGHVTHPAYFGVHAQCCLTHVGASMQSFANFLEVGKVQGGENALDALSCRSLSQKEPLIQGLQRLP